MKSTRHILRSVAASCVLATAAFIPALAQAHSVWIEELQDGKLCIRFAEWGEAFETSPGHLDSFVEVSSWYLDAEGKSQVVKAEKKSDQFLLAGAESSKPTFGQAQFVVRKSHEDKPARAPIFYCRWQPTGAGAGQPAMTLDIVPTTIPGEARIYFRGKPLGDVEVGLHPPMGEEKKLKADAEGFVRVEDLSKPGPYLLTLARHSEELPGFHNGIPFGITSHSASLYWQVSKEK